MRRRPPHDPEELLSPEHLLAAYRRGIFPMGDEWSDEVEWFRPDPRAIIRMDAFHVPRRLARTVRSRTRRGLIEATYDRSFREVIRGCAAGRPTWITPPIIDAYVRLHEEGHAHSVEVWSAGRLVGGLYGVQIGGAFMAESKFRRERDASKIALVLLVERLRERGFRLLEVQYLTDHLAQFGAVEISLRRYLRELEKAARLDCRFA